MNKGDNLHIFYRCRRREFSQMQGGSREGWAQFYLKKIQNLKKNENYNHFLNNEIQANHFAIFYYVIYSSSNIHISQQYRIFLIQKFFRKCEKKPRRNSFNDNWRDRNTKKVRLEGRKKVFIQNSNNSTSSFCLAQELARRERPYYASYGRTRLFLHGIVTSKYFDLAIAAVIG